MNVKKEQKKVIFNKQLNFYNELHEKILLFKNINELVYLI